MRGKAHEAAIPDAGARTLGEGYVGAWVGWVHAGTQLAAIDAARRRAAASVARGCGAIYLILSYFLGVYNYKGG